ncbi:MAG TPA: hypothetical protein VK504_22150 [Vicinamibacterales bacterium]|nr:hypothetical protein [Vicinamibacterales bacterium]
MRVGFDVRELAVVPDRFHEKRLLQLGCAKRELQGGRVLPLECRHDLFGLMANGLERGPRLVQLGLERGQLGRRYAQE